MRYDDFVLHIGGQRPAVDGGAYALRVLQSPAGEGGGLFRPPVGRAETSTLWASRRTSGQMERSSSTATASTGATTPPPPPGASVLTPQEIGGQLFDAVFREQVLGLYDRSLGSLRDTEGQGLRLKIRLDQEAMAASDLGDLPWELLYRRETGSFLALDRRSSVVRYLDVPQPSKPIPLPETLKVLVVTANPRSLPRLILDTEVAKLRQAAAETPNWDLEVVEDASVDGLRAACRRRGPFHIVHFMGHGGFDPASGEGVLYFQHPDGSAQPVSGRDLAAKLQDLDGLGLVFLNACETAMSGGADPFSGVACSLVRGGLPAVVAMQRPISDRAAILFSSTFYAALASGLCGDEALVEARQAVHSDAPESLEWTTPVLFARLREGTLFEPPPKPEPAWKRWLATAGIALLSILATWVISGLGGRTEVLTLDQAFATSVDGVEGIVRRVEIAKDGTMRVFFELTNESAEDRTVGFDWTQTFLQDDQDQRYEVLRSNTPMDAREWVQTVPVGESREIWFDVPAPEDETRRLGVVLAASEGSEVSYPAFEIEFPDPPDSPEGREAPSAFLLGANLNDLEARRGAVTAAGWPKNLLQGPIAVPTVADSIGMRILGIYRAAPSRMRWRLEWRNTGPSPTKVGLAPRQTGMTDSQGRSYGVQAAPSNGFVATLAPGERQETWVDVESPYMDAGALTFRPGNVPGAVSMSPVTVGEIDWPGGGRLPPPEEEKSSKPSVASVTQQATTVVGTFQLQGGEKELTTTLSGLRAKIVSADRLDNGRLRWNLELWNGTGGTLRVGFDPGRTYLFQGSNRYRLDRTSSGTGKTPVRIDLPPGRAWRFWVEFAGNFEGKDTFRLYLGSPDENRYTYHVQEMNLPR